MEIKYVVQKAHIGSYRQLVNWYDFYSVEEAIAFHRERVEEYKGRHYIEWDIVVEYED